MVTSNKLPDKKVVNMSEHINSVVVPQRTLLGEVNEHITCPLCRGYYIDATTIVECLHSFCRSCIIKHLKVKSYCPVCEMMINSAKPNIKLDKALQDIVYKLVPGLFQKEMERRQQFYASRPGPAASATPEQRGEDTERIIFSPEDVISFSLEYADVTDTDSISSKSSDSSESQSALGITRRYLQCPAVVNISHLKKFLSMKFDIDSTQFAIDILYKRVPLPDYYTLMDIAYIYNWKRNEPMRFFYQIIDFIARRNRLFDINRKTLHLRDRKSSPASMEDRSISSPALHLNDQTSEASSGTDSPMPGDVGTKQINDNISNTDALVFDKEATTLGENKVLPSCSNDDVEKSQFLNSFELTAKSNCVSLKVSPSKSGGEESTSESIIKSQLNSAKIEDKLLKRKQQIPPVTPEFKKFKAEMEKARLSSTQVSNIQTPVTPTLSSSNSNSKLDTVVTKKDSENVMVKSPLPIALNVSKSSPPPLVLNVTKTSPPPLTLNVSTVQSGSSKELKVNQVPLAKHQLETPGLKRPTGIPQANMSPKRKLSNETTSPVSSLSSIAQKPMPIQKPPAVKSETQPTTSTTSAPDSQKVNVKKIPDLKPSGHLSQSSQHKIQPVNKLRMDLLSNNCDPTIDRSKILSQVKCSPSIQPPSQTSGDPLKSLFDSCKLNIPSSLSITLTDQKLEPRTQNESGTSDTKKNIVNKNLAAASSSNFHKVPSPPVHNYIEILKLPDPETKKINKPEMNSETKSNPQNKSEISATQSKPNKSSETSAKGPVPNLKPIADTKLGKQTGNFPSPITFQQTFEQQLQSLQSDKKSKLAKTKAQVPKLVPATPKSLSNISKPNNNSLNKPGTSNTSVSDNKTGTALDLSTAHNMQTQLSSQQTYDKTLETMQNIANLAKKQSLPTKGLPLNMNQNPVAQNLNRPSATGITQLRIPSTSNMSQMKLDKAGTSGTQPSQQSGVSRQEIPKTNPPKPVNSASPTLSSPTYHIPQHMPQNPAQPSPRSQTRSPSSSPKLVIAEDKQGTSNTPENIVSQSSQITSSQLPNLSGVQKSEPPKATAGPSKPIPKPANKPMPPGKMPNMWQHMPPNLKTSTPMSTPADYFSRQYVPKPMDISTANIWFRAQRQFDILKSMSSIAHQTQNDFNNKDKQ